MPEQHWSSRAQDWVSWRQTFDEQVAPALPTFVQVPEQHWICEPHGSFGQAQKSGVAHFWPTQSAEQHCESRLHATFVSRQVLLPPPGVSQWPALQNPEQQSPFAEQVCVLAWQVVSGSVQTAFAQRLVQHSSGAVHDSLSCFAHVVGGTQVPLQAQAAPLQALAQQSPGVAQTSFCWLHALGGAVHVWLEGSQYSEQHSPLAAHALSFCVHTGGCVSVVPLFFVQPVPAIASAASADTSSVENLNVRMRHPPTARNDPGPVWSHSVPRSRVVLHVVAGAFDAPCQSRRRGTHP
jgi:hypothetical protein